MLRATDAPSLTAISKRGSHRRPGIEVRLVRESCGDRFAVFRLTCDAGLIRDCRRLSRQILFNGVAAGVLEEDFYMYMFMFTHMCMYMYMCMWRYMYIYMYMHL